MTADTQADLPYEFGGMPEGYWYDLVNVSIIKYCLKGEMSSAMRFEFLAHLEKIASRHVTEEMVQAIEPACDAAWSMYKTTHALSIDDRCRVMRRPDVFCQFIRLNPTIMDAIRLYASRNSPWMAMEA